MKKHLFRIMLCMALLLPVLGGCAGTSARTTEEDPFEEKLTRLIAQVISSQAHTPYEMAPAAVMPGSLRPGKRFSRLEELVMERLTVALRRQNDYCRLSRQNWFEFREGRPLTFTDQPPDRQRLLRNLIVYQVEISPNAILNQIDIRITGTDADGHAVPGRVAEEAFDNSPGSAVRRLYDARAVTIPFPEGLEERPYVSLDRLAFSLAAELADAYRSGVSAGGEIASDEEVRVVLYAASHGRVHPGTVAAIQDALQQAIVSNRGFTCAVSRKDLGPTFGQIDFYQRNRAVFEMEESLFTAGTVLLMADISKTRRDSQVGVALRAIWRASPLETASGNLIPTNAAGTYLSGFTAKAYLSGSAAGDYSRVTPTERPVDPSGRISKGRPVLIHTPPARDLGICFYEFTEVLGKRIYPVLTRAPGVTEIRRADELCDASTGCLCYELWYDGSVEDMAAWLRQHLRTSGVAAFRLAPKGNGRLNVYFDGGFK